MLWYAANKRKVNYPSPSCIGELGYPEVAAKLAEAYSLISDAHYLFEQELSAAGE